MVVADMVVAEDCTYYLFSFPGNTLPVSNFNGIQVVV